MTELLKNNDEKELNKFLKQHADSAKNYNKKKELNKVAQLYDTHDFWKAQPVPQADEVVPENQLNKPIDAKKTVEEIQDEPLPIPTGFNWCNVNIADENEANEVY